MKKKIINLKSFKLKNRKSKIVLCHGVFDLLHIGHIRYFQEAKKYGDILVVSVTDDKYVAKGPGRPRFDINTRMEAIAAISFVDFVVPSKEKTPKKIIENLKPKFYVKGKDYKKLSSDITKNILFEKKLVEKYKGKLIFTKSDIFSSSKILFDSDFSQFNSLQKKFLNQVKLELNNLNKSSLIQKLNKIKNIKILVIGETIIDKYIFCETVGKSGKEPMLVLKEKKFKTYVGGAAAIASQLSAFSNKVTYLSYLGKNSEHFNLVNHSLKGIKKYFIKKSNSPTILKTRYVDEPSNSKIFGVYDLNDEPLNYSDELKLSNYLKKNLKNYDLVIVSDYGHGLLSQKNAKFISENSNFVTLNCQINSNNKGHHSTNKYSGVNCVLINESELRYEMRDNHSDINYLMKKFSKKIQSKFIIITMGTDGCLIYDKNKNLSVSCPAFANKITDKVGAGDSLLSIFSILFFHTRFVKLSLLGGSLSASMSLKKFGNNKELNLNYLNKIFSHIL